MPIIDESTFTINAAVSFREIEGEVILIDPSDGEMLTFNDIAKKIWGGVQSGDSYLQISTNLAEIYSIDVKIAKQDTIQFLEELLNSNIITEIS